MLDGEEQGLKLIILQSIGTKNIFSKNKLEEQKSN